MVQGFLSSRKQCVLVNNHLSDPLPFVSGVPQGSILGPILFHTFVNDLPASITSSHILLSFKQTSSMHDCLLRQEDLDRLDLWSQNWNFLFNEIKCSLVRFSSSFPVYPSLIHTCFIHNQPVTVQKIHKTWVSSCPVTSTGKSTMCTYHLKLTKLWVFCGELSFQ